MTPTLHLAQINVARLVAPLEDPRLTDFVAQLDRVNAAAESSPGFVWRLTSDEGGASSYVRAFEDDRMIVNISVWESLEALKQYVYREPSHAAVFRDRRRWMEPLGKASLAMWWMPAGARPSVPEAIARLELLWQLGPTAAAFTFKSPFDPQLAPLPAISGT